MEKDKKVVKEKLIVKFKSDFYDLTNFIFKHPGGISTLFHKSDKNIEKAFYETEHSKAAEHLLQEYKLPPANHDEESIENLVDWNSAMIPQIPRLGVNYSEWVNLPVDRKLKLFDSPLIESLTKTPWFLPPLVWIPFIIYIVIEQFGSFNEEINKNFALCLNLSCGFMIWTFLEYTLHRYMFHIDVRKYPKLSTFHFLMHGLHHKVPFDEQRLVFPPFPAALLATVLYQPFLFLHYLGIIDYPRLLLAGALIGYLCYDMIHYYIHHGSPNANNYLYNLKRYHHNHHFVNHDKGFGISSTLWDQIFGTEISLKKLKFLLKWKF